MKAKKTEVLNLIHAGFVFRSRLPTKKVTRISGLSKSTLYKVKKRGSTEWGQKCLKLMKRP